MEFKFEILLTLAAVILVMAVLFRHKMRKNIAAMNKPVFVLGFLSAVAGATLMWNGRILGENTTGIATVIGIIGIGLIAAAGKFKKL
jgi:hypothetical protein